MNNDITSSTQVLGPTDIFCLKCGRYHQSVTFCPDQNELALKIRQAVVEACTVYPGVVAGTIEDDSMFAHRIADNVLAFIAPKPSKHVSSEPKIQRYNFDQVPRICWGYAVHASSIEEAEKKAYALAQSDESFIQDDRKAYYGPLVFRDNDPCPKRSGQGKDWECKICHPLKQDQGPDPEPSKPNLCETCQSFPCGNHSPQGVDGCKTDVCANYKPEPSKPTPTDKARKLLDAIFARTRWVGILHNKVEVDADVLVLIQSALTQAREEATKEAADRFYVFCIGHVPDECDRENCRERAVILGKDAGL